MNEHAEWNSHGLGHEVGEVWCLCKQERKSPVAMVVGEGRRQTKGCQRPSLAGKLKKAQHDLTWFFKAFLAAK